MHDAFGQSAGKLLPGLAAVGGLEDAAAGAVPFAVLPGTFAGLPQCGIDDVGVGGIDDDSSGTDIFVLGENLLEGLGAVGGAVDAALGIGTVGMSGDRDEKAVGIARIDGHLGNLLAIAQAEVRPGLAAVGGLVDAIADGEVGTMQSFTAADVDDLRVGGRDGDGADRAGGLLVEDRLPGAAVVGGLPDAAVDRADVEDVGLAGNAAEARVRPPRNGPTLRQRISVSALVSTCWVWA